MKLQMLGSVAVFGALVLGGCAGSVESEAVSGEAQALAGSSVHTLGLPSPIQHTPGTLGGLCGGIAGITCHGALLCDATNTPDASGHCVDAAQTIEQPLGRLPVNFPTTGTPRRHLRHHRRPHAATRAFLCDAANTPWTCRGSLRRVAEQSVVSQPLGRLPIHFHPPGALPIHFTPPGALQRFLRRRHRGIPCNEGLTCTASDAPDATGSCTLIVN